MRPRGVGIKAGEGDDLILLSKVNNAHTLGSTLHVDPLESGDEDSAFRALPNFDVLIIRPN